MTRVDTNPAETKQYMYIGDTLRIDFDEDATIGTLQKIKTHFTFLNSNLELYI